MAAVEARKEQLAELDHDRDSILERYAGTVPEAFDTLSPEEHHRAYKMLTLRVFTYLNGSLELRGVFGEDLDACKEETVRPPL